MPSIVKIRVFKLNALKHIGISGGKMLRIIAFWGEAEMMNSWSKGDSVSSPGNPPSIVSGNLAGQSGAFFNSSNDENLTAIRLGTDTGAPYGKYLEMGTPVMQKRPYIVPLFEKIKANFKSMMRGRL